MSIKEKPLIKAVEKLGPLPGFLFENMVFAGIFSIVMCVVFGGVFVVFQVAGRGAVEALFLYDAFRIGGYFGLVVGVIVHLLIFVSSFSEPEEGKIRRRFFYGGLFCAVSLLIFDYTTKAPLSAWFEQAGPLV
ncbi:hypothetical protein ACFOOP_00425 [Marinicaulis aureus]|uniref:Cell division protein FtsK n=1 Tax=Hyphococcus aureus TaxID=2666033 RepID=A0ABW1KUK7_9PROT